MRRPLLLLTLAALLSYGHDMFLKLDEYYLPPNRAATIQLFNGTFDRSDNSIDRNRMVDVSLVHGGRRHRVDTTQWSERNNTTYLGFDTGAPGTYVAGVSTRARDFDLAADAFNDYLKHDGVLDELERRKAVGELDKDARERYSKHVKAIFQVGETRSDDWSAELGYPIEFVPLSNPYSVHAGESLPVKLLRSGAPLANQLVYAGLREADDGHHHAAGEDHDHSHDHDEAADHDHQAGTTQLRTDAAGRIEVPITADGIWFLRTIHMEQLEEPGMTHESNWATLTFQVDHGQPHSHAAGGDHEHDHDGGHEHHHGDGHDHDHDHDHEGLPSYVWWLGSLAVVAGLFVYFNRKA